MKASFVNLRPGDCTAEEFKKTWENAGYALRALNRYISMQIKANSGTSPTDFDCPNHYAKLAFQAGKQSAYEEILGLLPQSSKD